MWKPIRASSSRTRAARLNAHYASQLVAAVGGTLATPRDDDSQTSMTWDVRAEMLVGVPLPDSAVRVGLRISSLEVVVLDGKNVRDTVSLAGRTLADGMAELKRALGSNAQKDLQLPTYDLPDDPLATNGKFEVDAKELASLEQWFENAAEVLRHVVRNNSKASPVRLWPHHFDIATLITIDDGVDAEKARSIGVGLSPGDGSYAEPYWYVTPWPYPTSDLKVHALPIGEWRTEGFTAAILTSTALLAAGGDNQAERVVQFVEASIAACSELLGITETAKRSSHLVWYKAADTNELPEGRVKSATCGRQNLCVTHFEGRYSALDNACPHQGGPLGEGSIEKGWLRCPWHGWDFHPHTGGSPEGLDDGVATYPVEIRSDGVYVGLPEDEPHERTSTDVVAETLVNWGVKWTFGMVGHSNLGLADALRRQVEAKKLSYVGVRHEGAAAFAVSAYGKLTGRPASCLAIAGPGATNLLTGLWDANVDEAPAIALTGQVETQFLGRGAFQEVDLKAAFGKVAQFAAVALHDTNFGEITSLACKNAILHRGVSHLIFPDEVQTRPAAKAKAGDPQGRMPNLAVAPAEESVEAAAKRIGEAKRPAIIVGYGARNAMPAIVSFAEAFGFPIITTFKGKGLIADDHPLACGVLGRSGTPVASWVMNESDLLIVLGSSFSNHTGITSYKSIVQIDIEPAAVGRRHAVEVPVYGEVERSIGLIREAMGSASFADVRQDVARRWKIWRSEKQSRTNDDRHHGINSAGLFDALSRAVPANAILPVDVGNNTYSFGRYFECKTGQSILMSGYLGSIGFALPAAMGAWAATQEDDPRFNGRKVISVSGDGGLGQYLADFTTLVKYDMDVTHVVLNNGELGKISKEQRGGRWRVWETSLHNPGFAAFAENCGGMGLRVANPADLSGAFERAIAHAGPALVEVCADALLF